MDQSTGCMAKAFSPDPTTLEGEIRMALVETRALILTERYKSEKYLALVMGFAEPALNSTVSSTNHPMSEDAGQDLEAAEFLSTLKSVLANSQMAEMQARQQAMKEFISTDEFKRLNAYAISELQDAGMATGGLEQAMNELTAGAKELLEFQAGVLAKVIEIGKQQGVQAASSPDTYRAVIRSMISRDDYVEMRMKALGVGGDYLNDLEEIGRIDGGDKGKELEFLGASLTNNGQLERLEKLAMFEIEGDANYIFGSPVSATVCV